MSKASNTRLTILQKAFELVYTRGYQLTSVDDIIAQTHVTKGAFYYHFTNKDTMGLAMIKEVMYPGMRRGLIEPLTTGKDPVSEIYLMMKALLFQNPFFNIKYGCPAINLIEEMAPVSKQFNKSLQGLVKEWQHTMASIIEKGKASGKIHPDVDGRQVACFISIGYSGVRNMGKLYGKESYHMYLKELKKYLETLR